MAKRLIHTVRGGHAMLLKFEHDKTHEQRFGFRGTHTGQVDDGVSVEQHRFIHSVGSQHHTIESVGERIQTCE